VGVVLLLLGGGTMLLMGNPFSNTISPDAPPDPAFDLYLPALTSMTDAPIMLPAELPKALENIGINETVEGNSYSITFLSTPPEDLVGTWPRYKIVGSLQAVPKSEYEPNQSFEATSTEDVRLPDGIEAKLRYMEPATEPVNYGPRWEGIFERKGHVYTLSTFPGQNGKEVTEQALSTMVEVER
jgi:hypothetical protein